MFRFKTFEKLELVRICGKLEISFRNTNYTTGIVSESQDKYIYVYILTL